MKQLLSFLIVIITVAACKKETVTYSSNTLVAGLWTGKYSAGGGINIDWTASLKVDGTCRVYETKIADTALTSKLDGVYNISEGKLKILAKSAGSLQVKFDGTLNNNSLQGSIVWNYIANGIPAISAGIGNLVKQ
jgi:hypothetical protein